MNSQKWRRNREPWPPGSLLPRCGNVGRALRERVYFARVDVEPGDPKFLFAYSRLTATDVAKANNADAGLALLNLALKLLNGRICGSKSS